MRVGIYVGGQPPSVGGGYTFEQDVLSALVNLGGEAAHEFVAIGWSPQAPGRWVGPYVSLRRSLPIRAATRALQEFEAAVTGGSRIAPRGLDGRLRAAGIDLVWCVTAGAPTRSLPYVTTVLDLQHRLQPVFPEVSAGREWGRRERFFRTELGRAAVVIIGNSVGQDEVERFYGVPPSRIRQLRHPTPSFALEAHPSDGSVLTKYGLEPGFLFYPAQFWPHKNHAGLLFGLQHLRDAHGLEPDVVFVGSDKGNEAYIRALANQLGLTDQVHYLGFVSRDDLVGLYQAALALTYMSQFGPENLPPLEAFALNCPVIASNVAGAREQLGDAAILVDAHDPKPFADAIVRLQDDPDERHRLVRAGQARAREHTTQHFVRGMFAILDELEPVIRSWR